MNSREKSLIIVTVLLIIILAGKSLFFDEVRNLTEEEQQFKNFVEYSVSEEYDGMLQQYHLINYRVFNIFVANDQQKTIITYKDPQTGQEINNTLNVRYTARVRGYILGILPYKQFSVTAKVVEE